MQTRVARASLHARRTTSAFLIVSGFVLSVLSCATASPQPDGTCGEQDSRIRPSCLQLPGRQVWTHIIPHGQAEYSADSSYGELYPLDYVIGGHTTPRREGSGLARVQQAGFTGVQLLQFDWVNEGDDFVGEWMRDADATWADSDTHNDFQVSPCMYIRKQENVLRMVKAYVALAKRHRSAAMIDGKYVVFVYHPRSLEPQQWQEARRQLDKAQLPVFLIGDLQTDSSQHGNRVEQGLLDPYLPSFDATWVFEDQTSLIWGQLEAYIKSRGLPFAGGIMPGYDRDTPNGGYVDAQATREFRQLWQASLDSGWSWVTVNTWNDTVERTDIRASSHWNLTRQEINAFFSSRLRGLTPPRASAELYVTSPDGISVDQAVVAEGMVINGSSHDVVIHSKLVDKDGHDLSPTREAVVRSGTTGDIRPPEEFRLKRLPPGGQVYASVWTTAHSGEQLQAALSAPILVYQTGSAMPHQRRMRYYSFPARKRLPGSIIQLTRSADGQSLTLRTQRQMRFLEVISETRQVAFGADTNQLTFSADLLGASANFVARAIDPDERVAYVVFPR